MALRYLVWIEVRKLETHPLLLIPGWTGFNIKVRDRVVVVESTISYLDTVDSSATDLKTAYEMLSQGCEIKNRLQLSAVHAWKFFAQFRPRKVSPSPQACSLKFCAAISPARFAVRFTAPEAER